MNKTDCIDLSADRLISIAADCIEDHDYVRALKMLNKNAVLNGNDEDSYMLYAEAFDDMELYEKCVNGWFKYIDYAGDNADFAEAYEGLAVSFMNMGQESYAAFYYNKLLMETESELTPENRQEIINALIRSEKPPLRFAWPPRLADYSEEMEKGVDFMRRNDYDSAVKEFEKVAEGNEKYLTARNYIAMCNIIGDKNDEAEQECLSILKKDPENIHALTTLSAVKNQQKKTEEAKYYAQKLLKLNAENEEDIYKIATVCCENGMHREAYELFCRLDGGLTYDCSFLFFKAVAAFNGGYADKSIEIFDRLLTIYPNAVTAEYWYYVVIEEKKKPVEERAVLEYYYRLPASECENNITLLTAFNRLKDSDAQVVCEQADISTSIHWCIDEGDGRTSEELALLGAFSALKGGMDDLVRDILLDAFLPDGVKLQLLGGLVQQNKEGEYGMTLCNIYRRIHLVPIDVGRNKRKTFLRAYSVVFARIAIIGADYPYKLAAAAEKLYCKLEEEGRLDVCRSVEALAAAILRYSEIEGVGLTDEQVYMLFGVNKEKVDKILGE